MLKNKGSKLALLVATLMLTGCFESKTSQEYFQLGQQHQQESNDKAAIIEYKNSLKQDPNNMEARLALGELYFNDRQYLSARKELTRVVEVKALRSKSITLLALVNAKLSLHQEILDLPLLSSELSEQALITVHVLRGQAFLSLNQTVNGLAEFSLANALNEQAIYSQLGQVISSSAQRDFEHARELVKSLLEQQPEMEEALLLYGNLLLTNNDFKQAATVFEKYIKLYGGAASGVNLLLVESLFRSSQFERANEELLKLKAINPYHSQVNAMMAQSAFIDSNFEQSLTFAKVTLETQPQNFKANLITGMSAFRLKSYEDSYYYLAKIEHRLTNQLMPQVMLTISMIKRGDIERAKHYLDKIAPIDAANVNLYIALANEFTVAQDYKVGLKLLQDGRKVLPDDNELLLKVAVVKLKLGDKSGLDDLAITVFDPKLVAKVVPLLVKTFIKEQRTDQLLEIAKQLKAKFSEQPYGWEIPAAVAISQSKPELAQQLYAEKLAKFPLDPQALLALAKLSYDQKNDKVASQYIDKLLTQEPDNYGAIEFKARLVYQQTNDLDKYKAVFEQAWQAFPKSQRLVLKMAIIHGSEKEHAKGIELIESISDNDNLSNMYWKIYGDLLVESNQPSKAIEIFQLWATKKPNTPVPMFKQIEMAERLGRYKQGIRLIEKTSGKFGDLIDLKGLKISMLTLDQQLASARKLFNEFKYQSKNEVYLAGLEGELLYWENKPKLAKEKLESVYQSTNSIRYLMLLVKTYMNLDQGDSAISTIEKHLEQDPLSPVLNALLAETYVETKSPLAVNKYKKLLEKSPNNPIYLNNMAWALSESGQHQQALVHIEKAATARPRNVQILDTYGVILLRLKHFDRSLVQFTTALKIAPDNIELKLHNIELLIAMNNTRQARRLLQEIERGLPDSYQSQYQLLKQQAEQS